MFGLQQLCLQMERWKLVLPRDTWTVVRKPNISQIMPSADLSSKLGRTFVVSSSLLPHNTVLRHLGPGTGNTRMHNISGICVFSKSTTSNYQSLQRWKESFTLNSFGTHTHTFFFPFGSLCIIASTELSRFSHLSHKGFSSQW